METRKSVPLDDDELAQVRLLQRTDSLERQALMTLRGHSGTSEASTLRALISLGLERVRQVKEEAGYAALAASADDEDHAYHAAMRTRRRGRDE